MRQILLAVTLSLAPVALSQQALTPPDIVIFNAKVFTADPAHRFAQAVAISGDRITAVGTNEQVKTGITTATKMIDARGRLVIPGLNSAHDRFCSTPAFQLSSGPTTTTEELLSALAGAADETPAEVWISGIIGPPIIDDPAFTSAAIDKVAQGHRVLLTSPTGHVVIVNSTALSALRTNDSRDPAGGSWVRDAGGRSTGKASGYAAYNLMRKWGDLTEESDLTDDLRSWAEGAARLGVTTIQVMPCIAYNRFERFARRASLPVRLRVIPMPGTFTDGRDTAEFKTMPLPSPPKAMVNVSGIHWTLDGFSNDEIAAMFKEAIGLNEQLLFNAAGTPAVTALLDVMKAQSRTDWKERRTRIEKSDGITADLLPAVRDLGIVVIASPPHMVKTLLKSGIPIALGSLMPYRDLQRAVASSEEAITREEALDAYTRGSAFAEMAEGEKGTIAPGKLADVAVLSQDLFTVPESSISETTSVLTIVGGKIVHDAHVIGIPAPNPRSGTDRTAPPPQ